MSALWGLVPSRGRPHNVERLVRACALTCSADTRLHFGFDVDDPRLDENIAAAGGHLYGVANPRMGLAAWTNSLAKLHPGCDVISIGDDMVPVTHGWDSLLLAAIGERCGGCGIVYPDDGRRADIPECAVISRQIVDALGWVCPPGLQHWYIDNVWRDIGEAAGCLAYVREVTVRHCHPNTPGGDPHDQTYADATPGLAADLRAYQAWRLARGGMRAAVAAVKEAREACSVPAG